MLYFVLGGFVIAIALFKRELLFEQESHRILLGIAGAMFVAGAVLVFGEFHPNSLAGSLMSPLVSITLFWVMRKLFRWQFDRDPRDTFLKWKPGMAADRLFNIVYFASALISWGLISAGVEKLFYALR
jgi:hypothetical protein